MSWHAEHSLQTFSICLFTLGQQDNSRTRLIVFSIPYSLENVEGCIWSCVAYGIIICLILLQLQWQARLRMTNMDTSPE